MDVSELEAFRRLFNEEKFFEAHEVLEALWRKTSGQPRDFYQGLIQIAASLVHIQKGTPEGTRKLLAKASQHLDAYPSPFLNIDWKKLLDASWKRAVGQGPFPKLQD